MYVLGLIRRISEDSWVGIDTAGTRYAWFNEWWVSFAWYAQKRTDWDEDVYPDKDRETNVDKDPDREVAAKFKETTDTAQELNTQ